MNNQKYIRTDLASECAAIDACTSLPGISHTETHTDFGDISIINILDQNGEKLLNKPIGRYVTVSFQNILSLSEETSDSLISTVSEHIRSFTRRLVPKKQKLTVLIVGLGNRYITSDAVGPLTVNNITVTRHIKEKNNKIFELLGQQTVAAVAPGVLGQTGIETVEIIKGAVDTVKPDIVIVIDALAAKDVSRLAATIQISDTGISPGSGIGNNREALNAKTLGVPVIALGVPTMVSSATLVYNALEKAGITQISGELTKVLDEGVSFFVTLNETDAVVNSLSHILAESINKAFSI